jgi:putative ABC transport system ATP-binding protein
MINLSNVTFRWKPDDNFALDVADFSVATGECVFICGPSGSGKSTLLNLLGGVIPTQQGNIVIGETNISLLSAPERDLYRADHMGLLFQMFNLMPFLSILDNATLPCRFSWQRRQRAVEKSGTVEAEARRLLNRMGLDIEEIGPRSVNMLSTGQQQRVAAARALLGSPEYVIADEPTSALDADTKFAFLNLLFEEIKAVGSTLVFVSHDNDLGSRFDRTISLSEINKAAKV